MVALRLAVADLLQRSSSGRRLPPILIQGEIGTGKTMLARLIHRASRRADGPFVDISCAAIPETLLEAELFGYERGAFTDAKQAKPGLFQMAHGGVLLLDEIGLMPMALQAKLLKAIDEGTVRRLGATRAESVNVAVVAATNEDLPTAMKEKRFREDLYSRLAVLTLEMPPLRARGADVELLAERFLARACADYGLPAKQLGPDARAALRTYAWPGNVRELGNVLERVALTGASRTVGAAMLGLPAMAARPAPVARLMDRPEETERARLIEALEQTSWNVTRTALRLNITRNTVRARIARYGLRPGVAAPAVAPVPASEPAAVPEAPPPSALPRAWHASSMPSISSLRWERRRIAFLSVHIPGDEPGHLGVTTRILDAVIDKVQSFGGRLDGVSPQRVLAVFGLEAMEHAPRRAATAAMAILKSVERERRAGNVPPDTVVALGLHVSRPLVARINSDVQIDQQAKRQAWEVLDGLQAVSGQIVVTEAVLPFVERHFEIIRVADGPDVVHRIESRERAESPPPATRFVGRQREVEVLQGLLDRAAHQQGQLVSLVGDPGIGKSRLIQEFRQGLDRDAVTVLEGRCMSYGRNVPYLPVLDILQAVCGVQETDPSEAVDAKVRTVLERFGTAATAWAPYVLHLLDPGKDSEVTDRGPEAAKARTFEVLQRLVVGQQERRPLVVVIEDLQWIDRTSEELLGSLAVMLAGLRVMLIASYRPGYQPPWIGKSYATQIALGPLSGLDGRRLVESVVGPAAAASTIVPTILDRGEGNPFFLEELARVVREQADSQHLRVPDTVHDVIAARTDNLLDQDQRTLQAAAVIGRDVPLPLLRAIGDTAEEELLASLERLQAGEFIYTVQLGSEPEYRFKHALIHDVVYAGLAEAERRALHERVAAAIETLAPEARERRPETLARHYTEARRSREAIPHWHRAAQLAVQRSAHVDALAHLGQALRLLEAEPDDDVRVNQELVMQLAVATSLTATYGYAAAELERTLARIRGLSDRLTDATQQFSVRWSLWRFHVSRADFRAAQELAGELRALAEAHGDVPMRVGAALAAGVDTFYMGEFAAAQAALERAVALYDPAQTAAYTLTYGQDIGVACWGFLGWARGVVGNLEEAGRGAAAAVGIARQVGHPFTQALAYFVSCEIYELLDDPAAVQPLGDDLVTLAREHSFTLFTAIGLMHSGWARARIDDLSGGLGRIEEGAALFRKVGQRLGLAHRARLADTLLLAGSVEAALTVVTDALRQQSESDERAFGSVLLRIKGEVLVRRGEAEAGRRCLQEALDLASRQGAWLFALRAAVALADLDPAGLDPLRAIAARFPLTVDSTDLRRARALLEGPR